MTHTQLFVARRRWSVTVTGVELFRLLARMHALTPTIRQLSITVLHTNFKLSYLSIQVQVGPRGTEHDGEKSLRLGRSVDHLT
jgi:hypothetical protein